LPDIGVTSIRETCIASCGDITPRSWLLRTHAPIRLGSPLLRPTPRARSLCRFYQPLLPAGPSRRYLCESFPGCLDPCHGGPGMACACFFLPVIGLPPFPIEVGFPAFARQNDFLTDPFFETAVISLCSGPQVCSPPRSFPPQWLIASGQPGLLSEQNML